MIARSVVLLPASLRPNTTWMPGAERSSSSPRNGPYARSWSCARRISRAAPSREGDDEDDDAGDSSRRGRSVCSTSSTMARSVAGSLKRRAPSPSRSSDGSFLSSSARTATSSASSFGSALIVARRRARWPTAPASSRTFARSNVERVCTTIFSSHTPSPSPSFAATRSWATKCSSSLRMAPLARVLPAMTSRAARSRSGQVSARFARASRARSTTS